MDRTLISGTMILDGSGAAPFAGDVLVGGQRIVAVQRYLADLLLVDGDPLADIKRLQDRDALLMIMKDGRLHKAPAS